ncbi:MAG: prolyl-tRNA synthetase associated domain-containing protein [Clostridiales bacterium]|nr:prolyl-tRNA synthetase associated domain-containing protein [Clostridiales bacterium]
MSDKLNHQITEEEKRVYEVLDDLGIRYTVCYHAPIFGHEDAEKEGYHQPGLNLKNMMVRERKKEEHYLVVIKDDARLDFKRYKELTGWSSKMTFASDDDLVKYLGVHAGSCSVFGLINDKGNHITVVLDKYVTSADPEEKINFHPNVNTATVTMKVKDFYKFLEWAGNPVIKE